MRTGTNEADARDRYLDALDDEHVPAEVLDETEDAPPVCVACEAPMRRVPLAAGFGRAYVLGCDCEDGR